MNAPPRNIPRSIGAVLAGFVVVFALSLGIDQVLHMLNVYPPWGEPMYETSLNALALGYRIPIGILGSYLSARLAPRYPMGHAMIGAGIGFVLSLLGAFAAASKNFGPMWYPVALAFSAWPTAWIGATLLQRQRANQRDIRG